MKTLLLSSILFASAAAALDSLDVFPTTITGEIASDVETDTPSDDAGAGGKS